MNITTIADKEFKVLSKSEFSSLIKLATVYHSKQLDSYKQTVFDFDGDIFTGDKIMQQISTVKTNCEFSHYDLDHTKAQMELVIAMIDEVQSNTDHKFELESLKSKVIIDRLESLRNKYFFDKSLSDNQCDELKGFIFRYLNQSDTHLKHSLDYLNHTNGMSSLLRHSYEVEFNCKRLSLCSKRAFLYGFNRQLTNNYHFDDDYVETLKQSYSGENLFEEIRKNKVFVSNDMFGDCLIDKVQLMYFTLTHETEKEAMTYLDYLNFFHGGEDVDNVTSLIKSVPEQDKYRNIIH